MDGGLTPRLVWRRRVRQMLAWNMLSPSSVDAVRRSKVGMRSYIRHPSDIPIEFRPEPVAAPETHRLCDVSCGGLSFTSETPIEPESLVTVRIACVEPAFEVRCRVGWCRRQQGQYLIGVEFLHRQDEFRARMVEQICHIEHYKREVLEREGRVLTGEQAAREWIRKYAKDFPELSEHVVANSR